MAISAGCVWEIQSGGAATNGGGYDGVTYAGGSDLSQGAPIAVTGMTTSAANATTVSCAAAASSWLGNVIYISGGTNFTADWYQITSVAAGTSFVVDRTPTPSAAGTAGTGNVGGPMDSPGTMGNVLSSSTRCAPGQVVFVKNAGSTVYSMTASTNVAGGSVSLATVAGSAANPQVWSGYASNRTITNTDTPPTLQASASSTTLFAFSVLNVAIRNLTFDGNAQVTSKGISGTGAGAIRLCTFKNCSNNGANLNTKIAIEDCYFTGCTTAAALVTQAMGARLEFNSNSGGHANLNASSGVLMDCLFRGNISTADSLSVTGTTGATAILNCTFDAGKNGVNITANNAIVSLENCLFSNNAAYGVTASAADGGAFVRNCAFYNETSGQVNTGASAIPTSNVIGSVSLTASPYTNSAGADFSLNATSGGGASCRAAGLPGLFPAATTTGYRDIGGVQHPDPAGRGGGHSIGISI